MLGYLRILVEAQINDINYGSRCSRNSFIGANVHHKNIVEINKL